MESEKRLGYDGEKKPDGDKNPWAALAAEYQNDATNETAKEKKIAEINEAIRRMETGEASVEVPDNTNNDPEYLAEMMKEAEEAAELLPADEREKFIDYLPSLNGEINNTLRPEQYSSVAEGINRVLGGEDLEDYRRYVFDKAREAGGDEDEAFFGAQNVYESVVGYFGPAERALNQRNRLLDALATLEDHSRVLTEAYNSGVISEAVREAEGKYEEALRDDLDMATAVAAIMLVPEEQKQSLTEYAAENAFTLEFEKIADGIFRHHKGDSLEDIKADLFPSTPGDVVTDYAKARNAENQAAYDKLLGFLGLKEEAAEEPKNPPEWIQRFLRNK
jgi:hypothetical protein